MCLVHSLERKMINIFVKLDDNVAAVSNEWYSDVDWQYFDEYGSVRTEKGCYLICDNGYIQWPTTICPYMRSVTNGRLEESFSANLESVRKDVECVFGILKTRWTSLDKGFKYRRIEICQHIVVVLRAGTGGSTLFNPDKPMLKS